MIERAQFHENQDVEVQCLECEGTPLWRKAKIVALPVYGAPFYSRGIKYEHDLLFTVQFADGSFVDFDIDHIRAASP